MADAVFPYPGGKSRFASWILDQVPEHTCFVEVFGGAAGVLANKDPDTIDIKMSHSVGFERKYYSTGSCGLRIKRIF